jgi:hypothetical protein
VKSILTSSQSARVGEGKGFGSTGRLNEHAVSVAALGFSVRRLHYGWVAAGIT